MSSVIASIQPAFDLDPHDAARRFSGVVQLYGVAGHARLARSRVAVIGLGGVGSWAAEALARTAVGAIRLVDLDQVSESNTNRQAHALDGEYGRSKVDVVAERLRRINPDCAIETVDDFLDASNAQALLTGCDAVIDAVDSVEAKIAMVLAARALGVPLTVCGATGGRTAALGLREADLADVSHDALLAKLRTRLRREHGFPAGTQKGRARRFGVDCLWIDAPQPAPIDAELCDVSAGLRCGGYGSAMHVTAAVGLGAAGSILGRLVSEAAPPA